MADVLDYQIFGNDLQLVEVELDPGEGVRAEVGTMTYMEDGIEMQTGMGGNLFSGFKRALTGESFFITTFLNSDKRKRRVAFAAPFPGKIVPLELSRFNGQLMCQKDSFLCAVRGTNIDIAFTKRLGAGFFGAGDFFAGSFLTAGAFLTAVFLAAAVFFAAALLATADFGAGERRTPLRRLALPTVSSSPVIGRRFASAK